jgi:Tfp pilus assembly protein PilN
VRRTNYLRSSSERITSTLVPLALPAPLRRPLAALLGALALIALVHVVQQARLGVATEEAHTLEERLRSTERRLARVRDLENEVSRLDALSDRIAALRRSGAVAANELATIGNGVPQDAWLSAIHTAPDGYGIDGSGARLADVGRTMISIARLHAFSGARLVAIHQDSARAAVRYSILLERAR